MGAPGLESALVLEREAVVSFAAVIRAVVPAFLLASLIIAYKLLFVCWYGNRVKGLVAVITEGAHLGGPLMVR